MVDGEPTGPRPAFWALVLLGGIGPFATDMYIAGLPQLRESLHTSATVAQLTLTSYLIGFAVGQLIIGPASDARGRRRLVVGCTVAFTVLSLLCVVAPTGPALVVVRLLQGAVAGGGFALGRAAVTDVYRGARAAAMFGTIASVAFLAPVAAPAVGGLVLAHGTWRTIFGVLAGLGLVMTLAVVFGVPETLPPERRHPGGVAQLGRRMADLTRNRVFMGHVAVQCLATAGFFTYIGGSAFVLESVYGISEGRYALVFATNAASMAVASLLFRRLVLRVGSERLRRVGIGVSALAAVGLLAVAAGPGAQAPIAVPWVLLALVVSGMGFTIPSSTALAQEAGRHSAGSAAALQGGLSFLVGAAVTPLTGLAGYDSLLPMAGSMALFFTLALVAALLTGGRSRVEPDGGPGDGSDHSSGDGSEPTERPPVTTGSSEPS